MKKNLVMALVALLLCANSVMAATEEPEVSRASNTILVNCPFRASANQKIDLLVQYIGSNGRQTSKQLLSQHSHEFQIKKSDICKSAKEIDVTCRKRSGSRRLATSDTVDIHSECRQ